MGDPPLTPERGWWPVEAADRHKDATRVQRRTRSPIWAPSHGSDRRPAQQQLELISGARTGATPDSGHNWARRSSEPWQWVCTRFSLLDSCDRRASIPTLRETLPSHEQSSQRVSVHVLLSTGRTTPPTAFTDQ